MQSTISAEEAYAIVNFLEAYIDPDNEPKQDSLRLKTDFSALKEFITSQL